jgi:hypothetical protein
MLNSVQKVILIPVLILGAGILFSFGETKLVPVYVDYPEHLVGAFTGGFGEETCHSCHFDYDLNWKEGSLTVEGIPDRVKAGYEYEIQILVKREGLGKGGFQMSARYQDGRQAGSFKVSENQRIMLTKKVPDSLQFIQHSEVGTEPSEDNHNTWKVLWKAPDFISDSIYINIASNAANGDQSEFGDWIYTHQSVVGK